MDRLEIEQLNGTQPYSFETEREQQWYESGLKEGLRIADEEPKPNKNISEMMDNFAEEQNLHIKKSVFDDIVRWILMTVASPKENAEEYSVLVLSGVSPLVV